MASITIKTESGSGLQVNGTEARNFDNRTEWEQTIQVKMWNTETLDANLDDLNIVLTRDEAFRLAAHIIRECDFHGIINTKQAGK